MILLQFCYSAGKTILLARSIFSKDYSLKEQTWLVIYERGYPHKAEVQPAFLSRLATLFLKGRHSPAFSFMTSPPISHAGVNGQTKYRLHHFLHSLTVKMENGLKRDERLRALRMREIF